MAQRLYCILLENLLYSPALACLIQSRIQGGAYGRFNIVFRSSQTASEHRLSPAQTRMHNTSFLPHSPSCPVVTQLAQVSLVAKIQLFV